MQHAQVPAIGQAQPLLQAAAVGDGAAGAAVAQHQAQMAALQAQFAQLAVANQPVQAPALQHVNPTTCAVPPPFSSGISRMARPLCIMR